MAAAIYLERQLFLSAHWRMRSLVCALLCISAAYADSGSSGCGGYGTLTNPTGSFTSHIGYSLGTLYPTGVSCAWTIVAPVGYRVRVTFPDGIDLEKSTNCAYDKISFYDGKSSSSASLGAWCGVGTVGPILTAGNTMYIEFVSDLVVVGYGFKGVYDFVPVAAVSSCTSAQFTCISDKKCIKSSWTCDGIIDCSDGSDEASCSQATTQKAVTTTPTRQPLVTTVATKLPAVTIPTPAPVSQLTGTCGIADYAPKVGNARIVGGVEATKNSWPWQAMVRYQGTYICGGTLINSQWIVTAAHCFEDSLRLATMWSVSLGKHNTYKTDVGEILVKSSKVFEHPSYNIRTTDNDIALIKLERSITFNDKIKPACLPSAEAAAGTLCYATGWGETQGTGADTVLKQAALPIVARSTCTSYIGNSFKTSMICAGYTKGGHDTCQGDSGGPLVCKTADGRFELQGITSWGSSTCAEAYYPGVYTRLINYVAWIQDTIAKN